jgi:hypothetical protein
MSSIDSPFRSDLLAGQVAFVTGGATGIGKEICRVFGGHGARIAIASRKQPALDAAAAELRAEGIEVWTQSTDVRDPAAVRATGRRHRVALRPARHRRSTTRRATSRADDAHLRQRIQGRRGHRPARHLPRVEGGVRRVARREHGGNIVNITAPFERMGPRCRRTSPRRRPASTRSRARARWSGDRAACASTRSDPARSGAPRA